VSEETCLNCGGLITSESNKCCKAFYGSVAGIPISVHVPIDLLKILDKKSSYNADDNYWVDIYYKGLRHGYHGVGDTWTYSARELSDLNNLNDFVYQLLAKKKLELNGNITTIRTCEENGGIHAFGIHNSLSIKLSFKPKGFVLNFVLKDDLRWEDKCFYNTKTGHSNFPYYYSSAQSKIVEWAIEVFQQKINEIREKAGLLPMHVLRPSDLPVINESTHFLATVVKVIIALVVVGIALGLIAALSIKTHP